MSSHRGDPRRRARGTRRPVLTLRDRLILAACMLGLVAAWLFYAGAGIGPPAYGQASTAGTPPAASSWTLPAALPSSAPSEDSAGMLPARESTAPTAAPGPAPREPAASIPRHITYPAAGMDVAVHPLNPDTGDAEGRDIVPPETMDGYWLTPFGMPGANSENTTYVIGHSWEGLDAPFNHLSTAAAAGDTIIVTTATGNLTYTVDAVTTYTKSTLKDSPVWDTVPNRLVLISCYTADPWGKNVVVIASPARGT